jgi:hypothetical protein
MYDARMQNRQDQIVENRLRSKKRSGLPQDEGGIFAEGDFDVHPEILPRPCGKLA